MTPDESSLRLNYQLLADRLHNTQTVVWGVVAMTLAIEGGLWVGMVTQPIGQFEAVLFGCAFWLLGGSAPLAIRFFELASMLDRQLLGEYERALKIPTRLSLEHGRRLEDRFTTVARRLPEDAQARLYKRRLAKGPDAGDGWERADRIMTAMGQPSLVWTSVIAVSSVVGAAVAAYLAWNNSRWTAATAIATFALFLVIFLSSYKQLRRLGTAALAIAVVVVLVLALVG